MILEPPALSLEPCRNLRSLSISLSLSLSLSRFRLVYLSLSLSLNNNSAAIKAACTKRQESTAPPSDTNVSRKRAEHERRTPSKIAQELLASSMKERAHEDQ